LSPLADGKPDDLPSLLPTNATFISAIALGYAKEKV
jgi:hypothetical protein